LVPLSPDKNQAIQNAFNGLKKFKPSQSCVDKVFNKLGVNLADFQNILSNGAGSNNGLYDGRASSVPQPANTNFPYKNTQAYFQDPNHTGDNQALSIGGRAYWLVRIQTGWNYDPDGRVTTSADVNTSSSRTWAYDAAGEETSVAETTSGVTVTDTMAYDGNGQMVYESVTNSATDYLIHSTVLGGATLTMVNPNGSKAITYVPANGLVAPMQSTDSNSNPTINWVHRDPLGIQEGAASAYDPLGNLVANEQPPQSGPPPNTPIYGPWYSGSGAASYDNANNFSSGCVAASGNPSDCNGTMREHMSDEFIRNLPGVHGDLDYGENDYIHRLNGPYDRPGNTNSVIWVTSIDATRAYAQAVIPHVAMNGLLTEDPAPQNPPPAVPPDAMTEATAILAKKPCADYLKDLLTQAGAAGIVASELTSANVLSKLQGAHYIDNRTTPGPAGSGRETYAEAVLGGNDVTLYKGFYVATSSDLISGGSGDRTFGGGKTSESPRSTTSQAQILIGEALHLTDPGTGDIALANMLAGKAQYNANTKGDKEKASKALHDKIDKKCK
jgi:hypothetical protein